jgi:hypothetical protein
MFPKDLLALVDPALAMLAQASVKSDDRARVLIMAIAGQESDWATRRQYGGGPARSYWQFERDGGVIELFQKTPRLLRFVCVTLDVPYDTGTVYEAMAWNDTLAASMARLLLWQDPAELPETDDMKGGWDYYNRNWRPGAPRPDVWPIKHNTAKTLVKANSLKKPDPKKAEDLSWFQKIWKNLE